MSTPYPRRDEPWQPSPSAHVLSAMQFTQTSHAPDPVPEHAQRYLEGLRALNPDVEFSAKVGATNTVIKQARQVTQPARSSHKGYVPERTGMLRGTHAFVDAHGQVYHPENVGHRVSVDEALSKAREDGADAYKGGYLWR